MSDADAEPDPNASVGPITMADPARWDSLLMAALHAEGVPAGAEATLQFISTDEMTELNIEHMGGAGPTDVLSFPIDGLDLVVRDGATAVPESVPESADEAGPPIMVGDVVICVEVAAEAVTSERTLDDEIALLVVHGALHLVGHDHFDPDERQIMQQREQALLELFYK